MIRRSATDKGTWAMEAFQHPRKDGQAAYVFTYLLAVVGTIVLRSINIPGFIWGCGGEGGGRWRTEGTTSSNCPQLHTGCSMPDVRVLIPFGISLLLLSLLSVALHKVPS